MSPLGGEIFPFVWFRLRVNIMTAHNFNVFVIDEPLCKGSQVGQSVVVTIDLQGHGLQGLLQDECKGLTSDAVGSVGQDETERGLG